MEVSSFEMKFITSSGKAPCTKCEPLVENSVMASRKDPITGHGIVSIELVVT